MEAAGQKKRKLEEKQITDGNKKHKADKQDARKFFEYREKNKKTTCFGCRKKGHSLRDCPVAKKEKGATGFCFNCGQTGHTSKACTSPLVNGGATYASCFICKEKGHLASRCPKNAHGVYVNGGSCRICGGVDHLQRECPQRVKEEQARKEEEKQNGLADEQDDLETHRPRQEKRNIPSKVKGKKIQF